MRAKKSELYASPLPLAPEFELLTNPEINIVN